MTEKAAIENLLRRVCEALAIMGDNPQKEAITRLVDEHPDLLPEFSEKELLAFRHLVRTGAVKDTRFMPPKGYKVHGLLMHLREIQVRKYLKTIGEQRIELIQVVAATWLKKFEAANGDIGKAKEAMKALWGVSQMDSNTRSIFNQAFLIAKEKWETSTKNETA